MVFGFDSQIFEYGVGPKPFHMILGEESQYSPPPSQEDVYTIYGHSFSLPSSLFGHVGWGSVSRNLIVHQYFSLVPHYIRIAHGMIHHSLTGSVRCRNSLVADEEVEIFGATFPRQMT